MKKRGLILLTIALILGLAAAFFVVRTQQAGSAKQRSADASTGAAGRTHVRIGVLAAKRGRYEPYGKSIEQGVRAALTVINESGGILGRPAEVVVQDTDSSFQGAEEAARKLIGESLVSLLIGTAGEEEALGAVAAADKAGVPIIYLGNGSAKTCSPTNTNAPAPYVWGAGATDEMMLEPFLIHLGQGVAEPERDPKFYYFVSDTPQTLALAEKIKSEAEDLGYKTITEELVDERIRDYYQNIYGIFSKQPDILFFVTSDRATRVFIAQAAKLNVRRDMNIAALSALNEDALPAYGKAADGFQTIDRYVHQVDTPENKKFLEVWKRLYPNARPPTALAASAYGTVFLVRSAFNQAGSTEPAKFAGAMGQAEMEYPQGRIIVGDNHLFTQPLFAIKIADGRYEIAEYLGDVSHPGFEGCTVEQPDKDRKKRRSEPLN